jgi:tetratricopeptide (TPR) repeat protein
VGREAAITTLSELSRGAKVILIQGAGGVGKTALARNYLAAKFGDKIIEFPIAKETEDISPVEGLLEQSLRSLGEEPGRDFGVSLLRLKEKLQTQAMGVLIDNLEPALGRTGRLIEGHRRYLELLRVLADSTVKSITLITSREALGETLDISLYRLPILTLEAWQTYFQNRKILCHLQEIEAIWNAYQGNALGMKLLSERVLLDYSGNVAAFGQEQQKMGVLLTMDNLIKEQFDRLEKIDLNAYHLLCRMGCFRYQDVPTVPLEGLFCLLWDVTKNQQGQVVNALKSRSLVDVIDGEYQLHPLIREEAINRLRNSEDWETANRQAAEFWTDSVKTIEKIDNALTAFEAYYHYLNLNDFDKAGEVIVKERENQWEKNESLGRGFYRLGLLNNARKSINKILTHINPGDYLARLYNILGDIYWTIGEIHQAISCHDQSGQIGENLHTKSYIIRLS